LARRVREKTSGEGEEGLMRLRPQGVMTARPAVRARRLWRDLL
jgi:hypothetical protein